jgi:hypothetical protein
MRFAIPVTLVLAAIACSSYGETGSNEASIPADGGLSDSAASSGGADGSSSGGPESGASDANDASGTFCEQNPGKKACDDFEDGNVLGPQWNQLSAVGMPREAASIVKVGGNSLLRVAVPMVGSSGAWCMLQHEASPVPSKLTVTLTASTAGFGSADYVEVMTMYEQSSNRAVALYVTDGRMFIGGGAVTAGTDVGDPTKPKRYAVTMEGKVFTVHDDAGALLATATLSGAAFTGTVVIGVGLTYSDGANPGTIDIDDVLVDY